MTILRILHVEQRLDSMALFMLLHSWDVMQMEIFKGSYRNLFTKFPQRNIIKILKKKCTYIVFYQS